MTTRVVEVDRKCPICDGTASSPHHIKPISVGGTSVPVNEVILCKRCHDIVEAIHDETGVEYSPSLVRFIRLNYDLVPTASLSVARMHKPAPRSMDRRYTSDSIELCINCGTKFRQRKPNDILCHECMCWFGSIYEFMRITALRRTKIQKGGNYDQYSAQWNDNSRALKVRPE